MNGLAIMIKACAMSTGIVGASPVCKTDEVPIFAAYVGIYECAGPAGQMHIREWERQHPGWRVAKWRCGQSERQNTARI